MVRVSPRQPLISPPRPSFLPISEPIPVPTQRDTYEKISGNCNKHNGELENEVSKNKFCKIYLFIYNTSFVFENTAIRVFLYPVNLASRKLESRRGKVRFVFSNIFDSHIYT